MSYKRVRTQDSAVMIEGRSGHLVTAGFTIKEENFRGILYPGLGHAYSPAMWEETMRWLKEQW